MTITLHNLSLSRGGRQVLQLDAWSAASGAQGLLLGPSGSGKTTLLFALGGLLAADRGTIDVDGTQITALKNGALDRWRGRTIGFVFQELHIIPHLSVLQNIVLAGALAGKAIDAAWLQRVLAMLQLDGLRARFGFQLSTGEKQRVAIARAIAHRPQLLLADEPTSGLDDGNAFAVSDLLQQAASATGATLLIATHDNRLKDKIPVALALNEQGGRA